MQDSNDVKKFKGTTTVGLVCSDGVVVAADKRATMGYFIANRDVQKVFPIDEHLALTVAGGVGDAQALVRVMQAQVKLYKLENNKKMSVGAAATLLANILHQYKFFPFYVQMLVAGIDGEPRIFNLDPLGGTTEEKFVSTGSGSLTAYGYLENAYEDGMNVKDGLKVAARAVATAMKRDCASGDGIDLVSITKSGVKTLGKSEVKKLLESQAPKKK